MYQANVNIPGMKIPNSGQETSKIVPTSVHLGNDEIQECVTLETYATGSGGIVHKTILLADSMHITSKEIVLYHVCYVGKEIEH